MSRRLLVFIITYIVGLILYVISVKLRELLIPHIIVAVKDMSFREAVFSKHFDLWLWYHYPLLVLLYIAVFALIVAMVLSK